MNTQYHGPSEERMNILVLAPYIPYPLAFGGAIRIYHLVNQLARRHNVHLLAYLEEEGGIGDASGMEGLCKTITIIPRRVADKRSQQLKSLFTKRSFQWRFHMNKPMQEAIHRISKDEQIDLILVEFSQMVGFTFPKGIPVVLDEHNVEYDLLARMASEESDQLRRLFNRVEASKFKQEELSAVRDAVLTLTTSERDAEVLQEEVPCMTARVITNGVDCDHFTRPDGERKPDEAVFVGATHYFPNEEGMLFFINEIHQHILKKRPNFHISVVGGRPTETLTVHSSESIEFTGFVDDVRPYMWNARVFVVPLRMGGGTRFKIVEAMAAGVPVVSTTLGAEGIPAINGKDLLIADDPKEFADAVVRILTDDELAENLKNAGLKFVRNHFDWSLIGDKLDQALTSIQRVK